MADIELPYKADYAKSARASCRSCKEKIEKDHLRLAALVQVIIDFFFCSNISHLTIKFPPSIVLDFFSRLCSMVRRRNGIISNVFF